MHSVSNDTGWRELREAMLAIGIEQRPAWRWMTLDGFESEYDREWFHHFAIRDLLDVRHVDVSSQTDGADALVLAAIRRIGFAAERLNPRVWRIFGYIDDTNRAAIPQA
jgi:hypothetical protein